MTKFKHTPGPWVSGVNNNPFILEPGYIPIYTGDPERGWIAEAKGRHVNAGMTKDEMDANAKLIAAAPELLEALRMALPVLSEYSSKAYFSAQEAIKKATE